jgi:hypothetical protein
MILLRPIDGRWLLFILLRLINGRCLLLSFLLANVFQQSDIGLTVPKKGV